MGDEVADGQPMATDRYDAAGARRLSWGLLPTNKRRELWDEIEAQKRGRVGYKRTLRRYREQDDEPMDEGRLEAGTL